MRAIALPRRAGELPQPQLIIGIVLAATAIAVLPSTLAAGLVLGLSALLFTLARLEYGLVLLAFTIPFGSLGEIELADFSVSATEFLLPLVVIGWVMRIVAAREGHISLPWIIWPLGLYLAAMAISITNSLSLGLSIKELAKWVELLAVMVLVGSAIRQRSQVVLILGAIIASGVLAALHGWYQFFTKDGPGSFLIADTFMRVYGFYGQPNPFAGFILSVLPLALALLLVLRGLDIVRRWLLPAVGILGAALFMTLSRGGMMGLAAGAMLIAAVRDWTGRRPLFLGALSGVLLLALAASFAPSGSPWGENAGGPLAEFGVFDPRDVTLTSQNWSVVERMALWDAAWRIWQDNPVIGIGAGNFKEVYPDYALPDWVYGQEHSHNYYLNVLAETGVLGFTAYMIFLASLFVYGAVALKAALRSGWGLEAGICLGLLSVLVALSLHNLFDNIYVHGMLVQIGLLLGLVPFASRAVEDKR